MVFIKKYISKLFLLILCLLSYIIPKRKGLFVFQQWHNKAQFSGNIKALILYANKYYDNDKIYIISSSKTLFDEVTKHDIHVINNKLLAYWFLLRADIVIIDATISTYAGWNLKIAQLWHGTGFKNIGLLSIIDKSSTMYSDFAKHYKQYKLVVATSGEDKGRKEESFISSNVKITGSPRNDVFFIEGEYLKALKIKYNLNNFDQIITYTPTFRDFETIPPFTEEFWSELNVFMCKTNRFFVIKKHPWDKYLNVPIGYSNIKDMSKEFDDVQELLIITDLLISDYSGIITDFVITGRPILLYMYDLDIYKNTCRDFYYDINDILPQPFIFTQEDLLDKIKSNSWQNEEEYVKSYTNFRNRFHKYFDGNSSERVLNEILKLSSNQPGSIKKEIRRSLI